MSASVQAKAYGIAPPGFRLPAATRLGGVRLQVADLTRSVAWYRRVLGLEPLERPGHVVHLGIPGAGTPIVELHERSGAAPVPRRGRLGLYHYAILLPHRSALGDFLRHLTDIGERAGMSDHLVSEALYLDDPDGNGIELYWDRPRESWPRDGDGAVAMVSVALDVNALLAEAPARAPEG
jgi:catechol 2,3-dioxygenase